MCECVHSVVPRLTEVFRGFSNRVIVICDQLMNVDELTGQVRPRRDTTVLVSRPFRIVLERAEERSLSPYSIFLELCSSQSQHDIVDNGSIHAGFEQCKL